MVFTKYKNQSFTNAVQFSTCHALTKYTRELTLHTYAGTEDLSYANIFYSPKNINGSTKIETRMWANAQRDGHPAKHRWRPLFNAAKFG